MAEAKPLPLDDKSYTHRRLWNEVAEDLQVGINWQTDTGEIHKIDSYGEVTIRGDLIGEYKITEQNINASKFSPEFLAAIAKVDEELQARNQANIEASLALRQVYTTNPDVSSLTRAEKEFINRLAPAIPILNEMDLLIRDERNLNFQKYLQAQGNRAALEQFSRLSANACSYALGLEPCSPVDYFPNKRPDLGNLSSTVLVPADITEADIEAMSSFGDDPDYNPYTSELTRVYRDPSNDLGWSWAMATTHPDLQSHVERLIPILQHAADTRNLNPELRNYLLAEIEKFKSDDPFSHYDATRAWVQQNTGNLEVAVGFAGGYSPMSKPSGMGLMLAVERKGEADFFKENFLPLMPALEEQMSRAIAQQGGSYEPQTVDTSRSSVRVVDQLASTSSNAFVTLAYVAPGSGPVAAEGYIKRIVIANHLEAKAEVILLPLAEQALVSSQSSKVTLEHFVMASFAHEMYHPVGPDSSRKLPSGGTSADNLGSAFGKLEEAKSNVGGLLAVRLMSENGVEEYNQEYLEALYTTYAAGLLRQIRFGGRAHGGGAAAELGYLFHYGALEIVEENINGKTQHRIEVNYEKMPEALTIILGEIGVAQADGNKEKANFILQEAPKWIPEEVDGILERVSNAGIPVDVVMEYPEL